MKRCLPPFLIAIVLSVAFLVFHAAGDIQQGSCGSNNYSTVQDEAISLTPRPTLNFTGAGVACVDNSGATRTDCTISGGGGASGAYILLEQHTASASASLDFTTAISATYDTYEIVLVQLVTASTGVTAGIQVSSDGGATYDSTAGHYADSQLFISLAGAGAGGSDSDTAASFLRNNQTSSNNTVSGTIRLFNPASTSFNKTFEGLLGGYDASRASSCNWIFHGVFLQNATAVNAFRIIASAGNLTSGTVRVYGLAK